MSKQMFYRDAENAMDGMKWLYLRFRLWLLGKKLRARVLAFSNPRWTIPAGTHFVEFAKHDGGTRYQSQLRRIADGRKRTADKNPFKQYAKSKS